MKILTPDAILTPNRIKKQQKKYRIVAAIVLLLQLAMIFSLIITDSIVRVEYMSARYYSVYVVSLFVIVSLMIMFQSSIRSIISDNTNNVFMLMIAVMSLNAYADGMGWLVNGRSAYIVLNYILTELNFLCNLTLSLMFWIFIKLWLNLQNSPTIRFSTKLIKIVTVLGFALIIGNIFGDYLFVISENGVYVVKSLESLTLIAPAIIFVISAIHIAKQDISVLNKLVLLSYPLFPYILEVFSNTDDGTSYMTAYCFCSMFFIFCNIYVRRERELVKKQAELAESKINSMMLQINPHFIYNTLGSVASLCSSDPEEAEKLLFKFSTYLRNNFGELAQKSMIPFTKEADHVASYVEIEKVRFPDIEVKYDYKVTAFEIPSLSIQPLVENAIKHGIMGKDDGGTIVISSYEDESAYHVLVTDNGIGFDGTMPLDGRNHVGVANVNNRLRLLCGGELKITGQPGVGTTSEIIIPKEIKQ